MRDFLENIREIKESNETNEQERPFLQLELQNYEPKKKKVKEKMNHPHRCLKSDSHGDNWYESINRKYY